MYVSFDLILLSSLTLVQIHAPSRTLFSQICYLTQWILVWNFQICLDMNYFWPFMLFFILNLSVFTLIWSFSDLICHSPWCFVFTQGTAIMQLTRSGGTAWTQLAAHSATAWVLLARSGARIEPLCQYLRSAVLGRHHSKTSRTPLEHVWIHSYSQ